MQFARFGDDRFGFVRGDDIYDITALAERIIGSRPALRWGDPFIDALPQIRAALATETLGAVTARVADVVLLSPVARPSKLIAAPVNYDLHIAEAEADPAISLGKAVARIDQAGLFLKATSSLVGPGEGVAVRFPDRRTDHEVELAVVIGSTAANIERDAALSVVAGYAIGLDMSVRGSEDRSFRKSIDSYAVLGPWLVTADEVPDPDRLAFTLRVNGELRQQANTISLLRNVRHLIAWASQWYTLYPGDIIYTGTPAGVGPVVPGDELKAEFERIGVMNVTVR
jgi:2-keto-4-pentenoate hydratase/2-oxohepta-3-ene-1,7-dioic acid hydratase in catechol pathway